MKPFFLFQLGALALACLFMGCAEPAAFQFNIVARKTAENEQPFSERQVQDIANLLTAMFGTPSEPAFPNARSPLWFLEYDEGYSEDLSTLVSLDNLKWAAGPVATVKPHKKTGESFPENSESENSESENSSVTDSGAESELVGTGLYREHCSHCHGISGDGVGPTSINLDPYPRDFRNGIFKFKSTTGKSRPSDKDLMRILNEGVHGTAMPSFKVVLAESEKLALIDYVKYLSIRGEVEIALWDMTANLGKDERLPMVFAAGFDDLAEDQQDEIYGWFENEGIRIESIFRSWIAAKKSPLITRPSIPPANFAANHPEHFKMIDRGRILFHGKKLGACTQCHGDTGYGDGELGNYDIWNKWAKSKTTEEIETFTAAGVLPPRAIAPRNFRNGIFRGGRRPEQLFYRIKNGIQGSEMPGAATLNDEDVWCLVAYVRNIKSEPITGGQSNQPANNKPMN